ncbi:MAG: CoA-binding protein [Acidimicrobiales bacterium]
MPEPPAYTPPTARQRKAILDRSATVAMVGASSKQARPSNFVATYLLSSSTDFAVFFVNPREREILGRPVYPSLADLPVTPDIVDVFRRPEDLPAVAAEAVERGARTFWAQLGLWSDEAAAVAQAGGLDVVMNRCLKIEHARFHGGLHLAGFDTGVVSSRRAQVGSGGVRPRDAR